MTVHDMDSTWPDSQIEPPVTPLTRDEAQALLARHPPLRVGLLALAQCSVGVLVAAVWWVLSGSRDAALSALFGAAVAVVPSLLMARAVFGSRLGRTVGGLVLWELIKILLVGVMLALAPVLIKPLSWPALLTSLVLCLKVVMVVLLWQGRRKN